MITDAPAPDWAAAVPVQPSVSNNSTFCGLKVCRCKQVAQLPAMFTRVLSRIDGFAPAEPEHCIAGIQSFLEQMSAEQWDVCLQGLAEPGVTELSPLQLMYGNCPIPGQKIMARDIRNLCSPKFLYFLHDDEYAVPESKRHADATGIEVLYEDEHVLAVNKPAGLITVPLRMCDRHQSSLMNRLLGQFPWATSVPRAGLVHRLDLGTSGVCLAAKNLAVYSCFKLQSRLVKKYLTVARGNFRGHHGVIRIPLRAGFSTFKKLSSRTVYDVKEKFRGFQLLECKVEIGRFHQVREHLKRKNHPIVGEYRHQRDNRSNRKSHAANDPVLQFVRAMQYPCLHASSIHFAHPVTQGRVAVLAPEPEVLKALMTLLQENRRLLSEQVGATGCTEALGVLYEDSCILVMNKPSGLITVPHPLDNRHRDSVQDRLVALYPQAASLHKAGLLARLDIGTSGVCLAAKNGNVFKNLLFYANPVNKYLCIAKGNFTKMQGLIRIPLRVGRHSNRMICAQTTYQVKESFKGFQLLECQMKTECCHQIREHLRKKGHAVVGDYPGQSRNKKRKRRRRAARVGARKDPVLDYVRGLVHPCLHAQSICFSYPPLPEGKLTVEAPVPQRFTELLALLRQHRALVQAGQESASVDPLERSPQMP